MEGDGELYPQTLSVSLLQLSTYSCEMQQQSVCLIRSGGGPCRWGHRTLAAVGTSASPRQKQLKVPTLWIAQTRVKRMVRKGPLGYSSICIL